MIVKEGIINIQEMKGENSFKDLRIFNMAVIRNIIHALCLQNRLNIGALLTMRESVIIEV